MSWFRYQPERRKFDNIAIIMNIFWGCFSSSHKLKTFSCSEFQFPPGDLSYNSIYDNLSVCRLSFCLCFQRIFLVPVIMSKLFLAAVFIHSHFLLSVDCCVSSAVKEAMYGEILARAQQRRVTQTAPSQDLAEGGGRRKYSREQAQLINDVTLIFGNSMTVADKYNQFKLLMTELGINEEPVSIQRFHEFSGFINRDKSRPDKSSNRGKRPKIGTPVSEKLTHMLFEKPSLSSKEAFEALEKSGVVPLPSLKDIQEWLNYRRKVGGFLKLLGEPGLDRKTAMDDTNLDDDDFSCLFSLLTDDNEAGETNLQQEDEEHNGKRKAGDDLSSETPLPVNKKVCGEIYNTLLMNARARRGDNSSARDGFKFTSEHSSLVSDVVRSCESLNVGEQFEVFRELSADLNIFEMSKSIFYDRAKLVRESSGCSAASRSLLGPETFKVLKSLIQTNPKISAEEAYEALLGKEDNMPSFDDVRKWLKNQKSYLHRIAKKRGLVNHLG